MEIQIRPPKPTDLNFITSTFLKSMKRESSLGRQCSTRIFFAEFPKVIDHILSKSKVSIACEKDNEDNILGYLIYEPDSVIHYCYTKAALRQLNVAKDLVSTAFPGAKTWQFSHNTNSSKKITQKYPELIYNPFNLYKKEVSL